MHSGVTRSVSWTAMTLNSSIQNIVSCNNQTLEDKFIFFLKIKGEDIMRVTIVRITQHPSTGGGGAWPGPGSALSAASSPPAPSCCSPREPPRREPPAWIDHNFGHVICSPPIREEDGGHVTALRQSQLTSCWRPPRVGRRRACWAGRGHTEGTWSA